MIGYRRNAVGTRAGRNGSRIQYITNPRGEAYLDHESLGFDTTIETAPLKLVIDLRILT